MAALDFTHQAERKYEYGIERVVVHSKDQQAVVWPGVTSLEEDAVREVKTYYLDGTVFLNSVSPGAFQGRISAYGYPEILQSLQGMPDIAPRYNPTWTGFYLSDQSTPVCNLSYQTSIGSNLNPDLGYRLHLLYNVSLIPRERVNNTLGLNVEPSEFSWDIRTAAGDAIFNTYGTHVVFDSTTTPEWWLTYLKDLIYGTTEADPYFPSLLELAWAFGTVVSNGPPSFPVTIQDNGDGTWTATDTEGNITIINGDFTITNVNATNITANSYDLEVNE